jgi:hypothetical protein
LGAAGALAGLVRVIDDGVGRPRDVVEAATSDAGLGALLVAVRNGHLEVCRYLVQGLRVDVDAADNKGLFLPNSVLSNSLCAMLVVLRS